MGRLYEEKRTARVSTSTGSSVEKYEFVVYIHTKISIADGKHDSAVFLVQAKPQSLLLLNILILIQDAFLSPTHVSSSA